jgi:hypothetical protein
MKPAALLSVVALLLAWLAWNIWNLFRIAADLRTASYRRPMWWTRILSVTLFAGSAIWAWGISRGGLDIEETCRFDHGQRYDDVFWESHSEKFQKLFPLHNKCNEHYDMVPAWVNPSIVVLTLLAAVSLCAALHLLVRDRAAKRKKTPA